MKCTKCGFIGFDHVRSCAKCGKDLEAVRHDLNLLDFAPAVPSFLVEAMLRKSQKSKAAAAALETSSPESGEALDLLAEIDLKVDLDEKPEEITLELLDEGEEVLIAPQPSEAASTEQGSGEESILEEQLPSFEQGLQDVDLKIEGDDEGQEKAGVFDLADVEDAPEFMETLNEESLSDEALERLRRELESADGLLKDMEKEAPDETPLKLEPMSPSEVKAPVEEVLSIEGHVLDEKDLKTVDESAQDDKDEDVFILMEERDGGLAVQEFSLEEGVSKEVPSAQTPEDGEFILDLDALTEELKPEEGQQKAAADEDLAVDGLVLELEDGFYIEPDEDEEEEPR
ncbi:hypothetical protein [Desulfosoma caldarium]|uniref:Uncharacterized protein n=1 Tax=Desulfosoma caldarium TaxID=610254 RepID=A0A3N1UXU9_9BACT|nr:hypothetical protein [Desulfosoma caldarium]ROQ93500.1 hypothetical protein EDC27_1521 [Desulfosoma caldarium]